LKTLISVLFFVLANSSFADDMRYYDIEVIVIENLSEKARTSENWPLQVNLTQAEKTVQLGQPVLSEWLPQDIDLKSSYKVLNSSHYQLTSEVKKISESKTQRVIFHTAWRQPGLDKNQALPVYFKHEVAAPHVIEDEESTETAENGEIVSTQKTNTSPSILEGILRVTLSRYLHLEAELTFKNKVPDMVKSDNPFSVLDNEDVRTEIQKQGVIHLNQKRRRIRSNELHYIDHPVLGMLINITRYEKPEDKSIR
jgi:Peptidoglycan-binding protein, CsiV